MRESEKLVVFAVVVGTERPAVSGCCLVKQNFSIIFHPAQLRKTPPLVSCSSRGSTTHSLSLSETEREESKRRNEEESKQKKGTAAPWKTAEVCAQSVVWYQCVVYLVG